MRARLFIILAVALVGIFPAAAAPYCLEIQGITPQCLYFDATECNRRAIQLGGICDANPAELIIPPGAGRFCVVGPNIGSQCLYSDRNSCQTAAIALGGTCSENPNKTGQVNPNSTAPDLYATPPGPSSTQASPYSDEPGKAY